MRGKQHVNNIMINKLYLFVFQIACSLKKDVIPSKKSKITRKYRPGTIALREIKKY